MFPSVFRLLDIGEHHLWTWIKFEAIEVDFDSCQILTMTMITYILMDVYIYRKQYFSYMCQNGLQRIMEKLVDSKYNRRK